MRLEQTATMQQISTSVQNASELAQKTVDAFPENFKILEESKNGQLSSAKSQTFSRKGNAKAY